MLVALFFLGAIIVTGGAVRLTGSGLGCPDWPRCNASELVAETSYHQRIELGNRLFTGGVSVAVILAVLGALIRVPRRRDLTLLSLGLVAGVLGQIVLGGLSVIFHLWPPLIMAHFLLSMVILADGVVLHWRASLPDPPDAEAPVGARNKRLGPVRPWGERSESLVDNQLRRLSQVLVGLTVAVIVVGTAVTGSGPHGGDEDVERLPLLLPEVARVHGVLVEVFSLTTLAVLVLLWRRGAPKAVLRRGELVLGVSISQSIVGYVQYFTGVPPLLVAVHLVGAVCLWVAVLRFYLGLSAPVGSSDDPGPKPAHAAVLAA